MPPDQALMFKKGVRPCASPFKRQKGEWLVTRAFRGGCACFAVALQGCIPFTVTEWNFLSVNPQRWEAGSAEAELRLKEVAVTHADGNISSGLYLSSVRPAATVLLFLGNGEVVDREGATRLWQLSRLGVDAYVFDRRGYGRTPGKPFIKTLAADGLEIFDDVRKRARGPVIVHGFSLGSMVAGHVASERAVDALVLEASSPNAAEYLAEHTPWYMSLLLRIKLSPDLQHADNGAMVQRYQGPLLIAVGDQDTDTVPALSKRLFDLATSPRKQLAIIPKADHYALITPAGFEVYRSFILSVAGGV